MTPPKKVKVGPYDYGVRFDDDAMSAAGANGACLPDTATVLLDSTCSPSTERDTVLHELLHAVWKQTHLVIDYPDSDSDSPGEKLIQTLAPRLLGLLRDNPKLVTYLTEKP